MAVFSRHFWQLVELVVSSRRGRRIPGESDAGTRCTGGWSGLQSRSEHNGEETILLPMLGIEPQLLGCTAGSLSSVPTTVPQMKVAHGWFFFFKKKAGCKDFESIQLGSGAIQ